MPPPPHPPPPPLQLFPVISFLHGYNSGGDDDRFNKWYAPICRKVASYGFVIVAPLTSRTVACPRQSEDQLTALAANFSAAGVPADPAAAAVMGQSSGGPPTIASAAARRPGLKAAFILHPAGGDAAIAAGVRVPIVFGTGSLDFVAPAREVLRKYEAAPVADKSFGVLFGAGHVEAAGGRDAGGGGRPGRWPVWIGHFFRCHLNADPRDCRFFYRHFCAQDVDWFTRCRVPDDAPGAPPPREALPPAKPGP